MLVRVVPGTSLRKRYQLGRYPLPHRGMGDVWPAHDTRLDRPVIVKFIDAAMVDADLVRRFRREALLTARLDHPGVPAIYDIDDHEGQPYVVLQKVDGVTLADLVAEEGPLPIGWAAAIGAQIASVLIAAERIGLVHRDIKPSNVMLDRAGAVKVLDFGLAVVHGDDRYSRITRSGQSLGTAGYMAPEQILGEPTDHRTDLYGLGATLFNLLTARPPFDGTTVTVTQRQQLLSPPPRPAELRPEIPEAFDELVHALLAPRPEDRPATAAGVYEALAPLCQELPPMPGLFDDTAEAVRAYAAVIGRVPAQPHVAVSRTHLAVTPTAAQTGFDPAQAVKHAQEREATGEWRAAARQWRRLADQHAGEHGADAPQVFDFRHRAARAHVELGEHERAVRLLTSLLRDRIRVDGPEHPDVRELRQEIERLGG